MKRKNHLSWWEIRIYVYTHVLKCLHAICRRKMLNLRRSLFKLYLHEGHLAYLSCILSFLIQRLSARAKLYPAVAKKSHYLGVLPDNNAYNTRLRTISLSNLYSWQPYKYTLPPRYKNRARLLPAQRSGTHMCTDTQSPSLPIMNEMYIWPLAA